MRINNNLMAMNTHRQLGIGNSNGAKSMEKLSSGFRINRAGDDAAGLSISEKMRGQIRGLNQASRNAQDGISMIQTAEGALSETHAILQRMRELAVQSGNDTNVGIDREAIQNEFTQLKEEIDRIGNTTEFNTQKLLDGNASASGVSLSSTQAKGVAAKGGEINALKAVDFTTLPTTAAHKLQVSVKDATGTADAVFSIDGTQFTTLWNLTDAGKAGTNATVEMKQEALVEVLNQMSSAGDVKLTQDQAAARKVGFSEIVDVSISPEGKLSLASKIGGQNITIVSAETTAEFTALLGLQGAETANMVGTGTAQIEATLFGSAKIATTDTLNLDDFVGKTFTVTYNGRTANITLPPEASQLETDDNTRNAGNVKASSLVSAFNNALNQAFGNQSVVASIGANPNNINDTNTYFQFKTDSTKIATDAPGGVQPEFSIKGKNLDKILGAFVPGQSGSGGRFEANFQIGANEGQSMKIAIEDMRAEAIGIADIDLSTKEGAEAAITTIQSAIEQVSSQRSSLGAFQNRLEHTIKNLETSAENLQASESRIRDVDMAKEMMEFTKNNILQQAAQAMLAQANQAPQGVLQLLR